MAHSEKKMITIFVTTNCNMECIYCYASYDRQCMGNIDIDLDFARYGIKDYFDHGNNGIRYFGIGDPATKIDIMKELHRYAKELCTTCNVPLISEIQTNGFTSSENAEWIAKEITNVWISIDGNPEFQNKQRPLKNGQPSSEVVVNNIIRMLEIKSNSMDGYVGARVTITKENLEYQKEIVKYLYDLGIKYIYSDPVCLTVQDNIKNSRSVDPVDYVLGFIDAYEYAKHLGVFYGNFYMANYGEKTNIHCRSCIPTPHLTPDGYVTCCDMCCSGLFSTHMDKCIYGKWNPEKKEIEYYPDRIKTIQNRQVDNLVPCQTCDIKYNCAGGCLGEALNENGNFYSIHERACAATKLMAKYIDPSMKLPVLHP